MSLIWSIIIKFFKLLDTEKGGRDIPTYTHTDRQTSKQEFNFLSFYFGSLQIRASQIAMYQWVLLQIVLKDLDQPLISGTMYHRTGNKVPVDV